MRRPLAFGGTQFGLDGADDGLRHLVLKREDVGELAVVVLGPNMVAGRRVDQLGGDANAISGLAHAALQHVAHAEVAGDLGHVHGLALVCEGRIARDHEEPMNPR